MKNRSLPFLSLLCLLLTACFGAKAQSIYTYSNATNGAYASLAANLTASTLATVGSWGSNTPCSNGAGISGITTDPSYSTYNPANANSPALNVNITPANGYMIKVTSISVSLRRSGTGPTKARLAYSIDNGVTWINNGSDLSPNNGSCGSFSNYNWLLSTPQNVCSGVLKVRVYYFASGASSGTCQTANLVVSGTVTQKPVPSITITANPATPICAGANVNFTAFPVNPGTTPTYTWKKNGGTVGSNTNTYADNTLTGTEIITIEMNSNAPCAPTTAVVSNTITVPVYPIVTNDVSDTVCFGETSTWGAQTLTATGTYTQVFTTSHGCDSTVTMHFFVRPDITHSFNDTACFGDTYQWYSLSPTATGTYTQTFPSYTGCDSTVTLHLYVRPDITHTFADTICAGATYSWYSLSPTATGTYNQTFPSYTGCDSNVTLHLFVRPAITHTFADTICALATYSWGGQSFTTTGTYNHVFTSYTGCDSTVTLHLFVRPAITYAFADTVCALAAYNWGGQSFTTTGTYNHTFTSYTGCDSTVTLHLFVRPIITHAFADTICALATYNWAGQSFTATGAYNHTFTSYTGCDSIVTLNLFVRPAITHTFADTACAFETYSWGGLSLTATGTYNHVFTSYTGCDSTVTLNLFVRPAITHTFADTVCAAATYSWGGQSFTTTGTYNHTFMSYTGCDSVVTLNLFVRPAITFVFADTICAASTYNWAGQSFTATGNYNHTFTSYTGCDSVVTLHLYVRPANTSTQNKSICNGSTYVFGTQVLNATGTYNHIFQAANGCDSAVTLNLTVNPVYKDTFATTICYGATYNWAGQAYTATGFYTRNFTSVALCDSIVTLNLTVSPQITKNITDTICFGTTYTLGTQTLSASGIYTQTFTAASGCDSIVTVNLTVRPQITKSIAAAVCFGEPYILGSQTLTVSGNYTEIFTSVHGCDSTVSLSLNVSPAPITQLIDTVACGSLVFEGTLYTASTILVDTFHTSNGCDSVHRKVNVVVHNNDATILTIDSMGCNSVLFEGNIYTASTAFTDTFHNTLGCDSVIRHIRIRVGTSRTYEMDETICQGQVFSFNGQSFTETGTYPLAYKNAEGCDSIIKLNLQVNPLPDVQLAPTALLTHCIRDSVVLKESGASVYTLVSGFGSQFNDELQVLLPDLQNTITVEGTDANGCKDTASIVIDAQHCCNMWMPNAFSPNSDGLNDFFKPESKGHPLEYTMKIYDRWGHNVFTSFKIEEGWDGTINGQPAPIATYHFVIGGKCTNGETVNLKGALTLVR